MKLSRHLWVLPAVLSTLGPISVMAQRDVASREERRNQHRRIEDLIRSGDVTIKVIDDPDPPLTVGPPPDVPLMEWLYGLSDAVVLARIDTRMSRMTAGGDWVRSNVSTRVVEVFKSPRSNQLRSGATFTIREEGGEVAINGTTVQAVVSRARPLERGQLYLMFLTFDPENRRFLYGPDSTYRLSESRFVKQSITNDPASTPDDIGTDLSDHVLIELRELMRQAGERAIN